MQKPTIILGASTNPERYSYIATEFLQQKKHPVYPVGIKKGEILGNPILNDFETLKHKNIHTITLYLNEQNQKQWYDKILDIKPVRVIFNPGSENQELENILNHNHIETVNACTLVLLRTGQY
ncbi:MAG: CoA-binding protein [Bacteroidetes bacterium]|nr:CoA-binding protein [Bacteroidota bacterium]